MNPYNRMRMYVYNIAVFIAVVQRHSRLSLYRVAQKSKLLIFSEYVNKTEKIGGT